MTENDVLVAELEARRFLGRISELKRLIDKIPKERKGEWLWGCAETAAVKRASMDLTKVLARLRRRDHGQWYGDYQ